MLYQNRLMRILIILGFIVPRRNPHDRTVFEKQRNQRVACFVVNNLRLLLVNPRSLVIAGRTRMVVVIVAGVVNRRIIIMLWWKGVRSWKGRIYSMRRRRIVRRVVRVRRSTIIIIIRSMVATTITMTWLWLWLWLWERIRGEHMRWVGMMRVCPHVCRSRIHYS
ncbi:hypothetical protein Hanom_Chr04g00280141 [Helianthus anomalus]